MAHLNNRPSGNDLPAALRALSAAGYTSLDQLAKVTEVDLLELHGMGSKVIDLIRRALNASGRSFPQKK